MDLILSLIKRLFCCPCTNLIYLCLCLLIWGSSFMICSVSVWVWSVWIFYSVLLSFRLCSGTTSWSLEIPWGQVPHHTSFFSVFSSCSYMLVVPYQLSISTGLAPKKEGHLFIFKFDEPFSLQIQVFFFFNFWKVVLASASYAMFTVLVLQGLLLRIGCAFFTCLPFQSPAALSWPFLIICPVFTFSDPFLRFFPAFHLIFFLMFCLCLAVLGLGCRTGLSLVAARGRTPAGCLLSPRSAGSRASGAVACTQAALLWGTGALPASGVEPVSSPLVGGFFTTEPAEQP